MDIARRTLLASAAGLALSPPALRAYAQERRFEPQPGAWRRFELTTDFVYMRLIGRHGDYPKHDHIYTDHTHKMQIWADALRAHQSQLTAAYVQCNNDYEGYSPSFRATSGCAPGSRTAT